jgi:hypothetical protein
MIVTTQMPPGDVEEILRRAIQELDESDVKSRSELINSRFQALPVFALTLKDVVEGRFPAKSSGWLLASLGESETTPVNDPALVEVSTVLEPGAAPQFASFSQGSGAKTFLSKLGEVLKRQFDGQSLELRILRIPAMLVSAFWISSRGGKNDRIVIIRGPSSLPMEQALPPAKFFGTLRPYVDKFRAFDRDKA